MIESHQTPGRVRSALIVLAVCAWSADAVDAQRTALQPLEWIVREANGGHEWPGVTPDGEGITYSRTLDGQTFQLLITRRDGRQTRPFVTTPPAPSLTRGSWSGPHRRIAFTGSGPRDAGTAIYVADAAGGNVRRIRTQGVTDRVMYPSWMPDGRSVVAVDYGAAGGSTLVRIDIESGMSSPLTRPAEFLAGMPAVSPDGQRIAFAGQRNLGQTYDQLLNQIWVLPVGGKPYEISAGQGRHPAWSPDGRWLAFTSTRGDGAGRAAVFVVDVNGRNLTQLTDHSTHVGHPVWSPDGTWLVVSARAPVDGPAFGIARIGVPPLLSP